MKQKIKNIKLIKKIWKYLVGIKKKFIQFFLLLNIQIKNLIYKDKIYIIGTPIHGNLGDQAIIYSENVFFNKFYPNKKIIEIESSLAKDKTNKIKKIIKSNTIFIHGGGFLGTIWPQEEEMFRQIIQMFSEKNIIVLPQTIFFSNDKEGIRELEISKKIYESHPNLYICCREKYSYDFMQENFQKCNVILMPDIVLCNDFFEFDFIRNNVLFCIRHDKEKINYSFDLIESFLKSRNISFDYTDTVIPKAVYKFNRKKELLKKLKQISHYKIMITDRLHGMVFAFLTKTPCLVFQNSSYKVKGLYKWISNCEYIKMYNEKNLENDLQDLLNINPNYNNAELHENFKILRDIIDKNGD